MFVILNVAIARINLGNSFFGFAIGFTVLAGAYAVGSVSGAAFNPAVALGMAVMRIISWPALLIYFISTFIAAVCAALVFKAAHPEEPLEVLEKATIKTNRERRFDREV